MTAERPDVPAIGVARRILAYLRPYRGLAVTALILTMLSAALSLLHPWPLAFIIDDVANHGTPPGWVDSLAGSGTSGRIAFAVVASVAIMAVGGLIGILNEYVTSSIDRRMALDLRGEMVAHSQRLPMTYHDGASTGDVMFRINDQAEAIGKIVIAVPDLALGVLTLVGMLIVAFHIDPQLALVSAAVVPFVLWSARRYTHGIDPELRRVQQLEGTNLTLVHEGLSMLRVIVAFGRETHEHQKFRNQGEQTVNARVRVTVRQAAFNFAVSAVTAAGTSAVVAFGAHDVLRHRISPGELLVMISYIAAAYAPLQTLANSVTVLQQQFVALRYAFDLLDVPLAVLDDPNATIVDRVRGDISVRDVSFSYSAGRATLSDVSFDVRAGEVIAIVGATGAGKTTLVNLLPRFYEPGHGSITIDGHEIRSLSVASLRAQFSLVLQEPLLFSQTIRENIAYSRPDASMAEIEQAARDANAHDFIRRLPNQYDTRLGERGTKVSVGERQRIAVARAFLRDAPIVVLDEPTSSIDSRTEAVILDALDRLMAGRTTIVVAHRLSTIRRADRVLVMDQGRIVQNGSHEELFAEEGPYRDLWTAQALQRVRLGAARAAIARINDAARASGVDLSHVGIAGSE